jgi:hypothetical protein
VMPKELLDDLDEEIKSAVRHFWTTRIKQGSSAAESVNERLSVTGGKQLDGFIKLLSGLVVASGVPDAHVYRNARCELPGFYRPTKDWDLVVVAKGELLAAMEFKSQVGPSFGNNFNNRTEEALGNAADILAAYEEGAFKPSQRPWLGFLMLLEDTERALTPVRVAEHHFKVFPEFRGASYAKRYELLCLKLVRKQLYDAACFMLTPRTAAQTGEYREPNPEISLRNLVGSLIGRAVAFSKIHKL